MPRILITGAGGFSGRHLVERLRRDGEAELIGLGTAATTSAPVDRYHICDLTDAALVDRVIAEARPDAVYHLAARTSGTTSGRLHEVNVRGFIHLCDALRKHAERRGRLVRMLTVGSAAELGATGVARLPVREDGPCEPETVYGETKLEVTRRALREWADGPLQIVVARTFNLVGPGLCANLALGRFARQIAAIRRGEMDCLVCGNLTARRDYVDVRDAVEAYSALLSGGRAGQLYNVCSGRSHSIGDLLRSMLSFAGVKAPIVSDLDGRCGDLADVYGDPSKTATECGWRATTPIDQSLADLLDSALDPLKV